MDDRTNTVILGYNSKCECIKFVRQKIVLFYFINNTLDKESFNYYVEKKRGGGHCVFKWILRGHLKPTLNAII